MHEWAEILWEAGVEQGLIGELTTGGESSASFSVQLTEKIWAELLSTLLQEGKIGISV
jgi:hypothetical protein